ncbi:MAG: hypothetical protein ACRYGM_06295 [Janthinobacterium lividum]
MQPMQQAAIARFDSLPPGYTEVRYAGHRYGLTIARSADGRRAWLYAELHAGAKTGQEACQHAGRGHVSCNLYHLASGPRLRPCEMPLADILDFLLGFTPA